MYPSIVTRFHNVLSLKFINKRKRLFKKIYVNGDMMKEAKGKKMLLSGDWGFKAGIGKELSFQV